MNFTDDEFLYGKFLQNLQKNLTYSLLIILLLIGNIGCVFNTIIFLRPHLIAASCSKYFLASSFANVFQLNIGLVSHILDSGFDIHPYHHSTILCKLRNYSITLAGFLSQTYLLLACIDRYLISLNTTKHPFLFTKQILIVFTSFWSLSLCHLLFYSEILQSTQFCFFSSSIYVYFISFHNLILSGFVLPILMVIFGLLTLKNIRSIRRQARVRRRRRCHYLSLMLISNVFVSVIFTFIYTSGLIYLSFLVKQSTRTPSRQRIEQKFITFGSIIFYYFPFAIFFYVNVFTSQRFRSELKKIFCRKHSKKSSRQ